MTGGIVPLRTATGWPEGRIRRNFPALPAPMGDLERVCYEFHREDDRFACEIRWNDFGLEERYGRFLQQKVYAPSPVPVRGIFVDLYV